MDAETAKSILAILGWTAFGITTVICIYQLLMHGKMTKFQVSKSGGVVIDASEESDRAALMVLDNMLEDAEMHCRRRMLTEVYRCFENNLHGLRYAVYLVALNHYLRDLSSIGFSSYAKRHQELGNWTDDETERFMQALILAARVMLDTRLHAYDECKTLPASVYFHKTLVSKEDKNKTYSKLIDRYINEQGLSSQCITQLRERFVPDDTARI
jgi:hypothetical protein